MIYRIRGLLVDLEPSQALVEVLGVTYLILIPSRVFEALSHYRMKEVLLHTLQIVREDSQRLFGFLDPKERNSFEFLSTVLGPKSALNLISHLSLGELYQAIDGKEVQTLMQIPGVGKKTAERMIVELKGKLEPVDSAQTSHPDALQGLILLGYSPIEAKRAIQQVIQEKGTKLTVAELLRYALQVGRST